MKFGKKAPKSIKYYSNKIGDTFTRLISAGRHGQYWNSHAGECQHVGSGTCHACRNPLMTYNLGLDKQAT